MFGLRAQELLIIFAILLLLFGSAKLPKLGASLGSTIRNFKKGFGGEDEEAPAATPARTPLADGTASLDGSPTPAKQRDTGSI